MGSYRLTRGRGDRVTFPPLLCVSVSPCLHVCASLDLGLAIPSGFGQTSVCGKQNVKARPFGKRFQNRIRYGFGRVFIDFTTTDPTIGYSDAGVEQPKIVEDFGLCSHSGPRISSGILLANGDGWSNSSDFVDVRLVHAFQKLPRVSRQRFHIPALALGIDGVKRKRRLTGP